MKNQKLLEGNYKFLFGIAGLAVLWIWGGTAIAEVSSPPDPDVSAMVSQLLNSMQSLNGAAVQSPAADQPSTVETARVSFSKGHLRMLGAPRNHYFPVSEVVTGNPTATAKNFIAENGVAFGVKSNAVDFSSKKSKTRNGRSYERFQQTYSQVPVFGAEVTMQLNSSGGMEYITSDIMRETTSLDEGKVSTDPTISIDDAEFLAIEQMSDKHLGIQLETMDSQLMIYAPEVVGNSGSTRLVWHIVVVSVSVPTVNEVILIDAHTGRVALQYTQIMDARFRQVYDSANTAADPGTLRRSEGGPTTGIADVDDCYDFLGDTYDFYFNQHGRDSIDNAGMTLSATVRICPYYPDSCPYSNAFWTGSRMYFGEGWASDDVMGHELTHGVTQYESGLIYQNESGAINESFSDMWGEWIDLTNGSGNDSPSVRWLTGEDLPIGAIRDMADPPAFGDPDRRTSPLWYTGAGDNGGVHTNSGVGNKLCYLLTDGDTFNGQTITGMGITVVADLFYEVQTNLLTSGSDYADLHNSLTQAAINLGWSVTDRDNLENACLATELSYIPPRPSNDECVDAICIEDGVPVDGTTLGATGTDITSCTSGDGADVWYSYTPALSGNVTVSLCGSDYDTSLAVFNACGGSELACNDDYCGLQSQVMLTMTAGNTYLVRVSGFGGATGTFVLTVTGGQGSCGPRPPAAQNGSASVGTDTASPITLVATDDGLPNPPGAMTYIIASLPSHGELSDPGNGVINSVPYSLISFGNQVIYTPDVSFTGSDSFQFKTNDGGTPPDGGDSNIATLAVQTDDCTPPPPVDPEPSDGTVEMPINTSLHWDNPLASCDCPESVNISSTILGSETGLLEDEEPTDILPGETPITNRIVDTDCYSFGGTDQSYSGPTRLRGNVYTFDDIQTLSEIRMILGFTGSANLYYYVLEATTLNGQYTPIFEKAVVTTGTGSALYSSGAINVTLQPGYYYGIGVAWNAETITYYRNIIHLPRPWEMGTVGKSLQYNGNIPITGPISPSSFAGAEYAVDLCFGGGGLTTYDVYLGADESQMELVATDLEEPVFTPCILDYETTYYWQVIAKNDCGLAAGPIWSFTTQAWQPLPEDGAMEVPLDTMLNWNGPVSNCDGTCGIGNGGFESGDFTPWVTVTGPGQEFYPWDVMENYFPFEGSYHAIGGFDGEAGLFYDLYQEVEIPSCASIAIFTWSDLLYWFPAGGNLPREYTVSVQPAGGGEPLAVLYTQQIQPGTFNYDLSYVTHSMDLLDLAPSIAGQTVRINFHQDMPESFVGGAWLYLDGISLTCGGEVLINTPQSIDQGTIFEAAEDPSLKEASPPESQLEAVIASQGGPDAGGYYYFDNREPGGPDFDWFEIAGSGTNLGLSDDSYYYPINLPFSFDFYGANYSQVAVDSNGGVYFEGGDWLLFINSCIPGINDFGVDRFIALYWDDLYPSGSDNVYAEIVGSAPNRKLIVQWQNVRHFSSSSRVTAQVQLYENGDILLLYADPSSIAGNYATVGIQNDSTTGLQYLCNQSNLTTGLAVLFTRNPDSPDEEIPITYDVYFGMDKSQMDLIGTELYTPECDPTPRPEELLLKGRVYYWQVVAKNTCGEVVSPLWSFATENTPPVADAGSDQTVFCWIDGLVNVTLNGSGSYDEDENLITYLWTWTADGQSYSEAGVSPTISLPAGVHTLTLVVNDGIDDSEPEEVVITAEPPVEISVKCTPKSLNCESNGKWIKAHFILPESYQIADVNTIAPCTLEPLSLLAKQIDPFINEDGLVQIDAAFDRDELCETDPLLGFNQMMPTGHLTSGHYFYGIDEIRILDNRMEHLINLGMNWLSADCIKPNWCDGMDMNTDGVVDLRDFGLIE